MVALMFAGTVAMAAPVDPARARDIAVEFIGNATKRSIMQKAPSSPPQLVYTHKDNATGATTFYAFGRTNGGYVLVAADDRAPLILGFSDQGRFDGANIPQSMKGMMESWSAQVAWLASHPDSNPIYPEKIAEPVEPLLGNIAWDQGNPYNRKCPAVTQVDDWGDAKGTGPAAVGCVATALGQIMYYHRWPEKGSGEIHYVSEGENAATGDAENINIDVVFEGTEYKWDNMLPTLTTSSPSEVIDAVSTLLYHVGASFESIYGYSTGATDVSVAPALIRYFNYDKGINYVKRDYYTTQQWNDMLLEEFNNKRPVAYGGVTRRGEGHFFVLDGVNADGYWHVNWGWSGAENGYYLLTLLEPGSQGIGGSSDGSAFHYAQNMIIGIQKPVEGSESNYNFTVESLASFDSTIGRQESADLEISGVWNDSPNEVMANLGFALIDPEGNIVYRQMPKKAVNYKVAYGENSLECKFLIPDNIPTGEYTVRPIFQIEAEGYATDHFMHVFHGRASSWRVVVNENNITWSTQGAYKLSIVEVKGDNDGDIESGVTSKITLKVHNDGSEFFGPVYLRLFINGKDRVFGTNDYPDGWTKAKWVTIEGNADTYLTFDVGRLDLPGHDDYVVCLRGNEGILSENYRPVSAVNLASVSGVRIIGSPLPPVVELVDDMILTTMVDGKVPVNDVGLKICINNDGGEWTGRLRCEVNDPNKWSGNPLGYVTFDPVTIAAETSEQWLTLTSGELPAVCTPGQTYELVIMDPVEDEGMIPSYYFSIEFEAGEAVDKQPCLAIDEVTFEPETIVAGVPSNVLFHLSNTGYPFNGTVKFNVERDNAVVHESATQSISIGRDEDLVVEFTETFELPTADNYTIRLLDGKNNVIGAVENISFTADKPALELTEATSIPSVVKCNEATDYTFGVKNSGFMFDSGLRFVIMLDNETRYESEPRDVRLARGEETELTFTAAVDMPDGDSYAAALIDADNSLIGRRAITITGHSGIIDPEADENLSVRYFNLQGVEISKPSKGQTVIMVKGSRATKMIIE